MRTAAALTALLVCASGALGAPAPVQAELDAQRTRRLELARGALLFLERAARPDGSFGASYQHYLTGAACLAFLSAGHRPGEEGPRGAVLDRAADWLVKNRDAGGFAGDKELPTESHAVAALALCQMSGQAAEPARNRRLFEAARQALAFSLDTQDRAYGGRHNGGWKADPAAPLNDRKVTAWQLALLRAIQESGTSVPRSASARALAFMLGSLKTEAGSGAAADVGGFSYDAEGLPVRSISAAGLFCTALYDEAPAERALTAAWFGRNPPVWTGPHFYYTEFFAVRALRLEAEALGTPESLAALSAYQRQLTQILYEAQQPDGSFALPPGNAEYTKAMGPVYSTALAVLILNADRHLLPLDREARRRIVSPASPPPALKEESP